MDELWPPVRLSVEIASAATVAVAVIGVPLAWAASRAGPVVRTVVDAAVTLPLVLPPTVVGYVLLVVMGPRGVVGSALARATGGYTILFRPAGGMAAAAVVALPLLYLPTRAAFGAVDPDVEGAARVAGAGGRAVFWHVSLPLARGGIFAGLLLAFARAVGEFGATMMVMGGFADQQTLPIAIYQRASFGDYGQAASAVWALTGLSVVIVLAYNRLPGAGAK